MREIDFGAWWVDPVEHVLRKWSGRIYPEIKVAIPPPDRFPSLFLAPMPLEPVRSVALRGEYIRASYEGRVGRCLVYAETSGQRLRAGTAVMSFTEWS